MLSRIVAVGLIAGLLTGFVITGLQLVWSVPMISHAETYENATPSTPESSGASEQSGHVHSHSHGGHDHGEAWAPQDGFERSFWTLMANIILGVGSGILLAAVFAMRGVGDLKADLKTGFIIGGAGFLAFTLMPSLGLPPELPGTAAADLSARQTWWFSTVAATLAGLSALAWKKLGAFRAIGVFLIALPHVIGAPHPEVHQSLAPVELQHSFIIAAVTTSAVFWLLLGMLSGFFSFRILPKKENLSVSA